MTAFTIEKQRHQTHYFGEPIDEREGISLDMVWIPGGSFLMGSPDDEPDRYDDEGPQHPVTVPSFFMGRYPITQAQWQAVAAFPQIHRPLQPDPSYFKGANRPVEQVSWYEAMEWCARLAQHTGRPYRLPSEAEWEYACRAGTTTPFHFGDTITTDLANYRGTDDEDLNWKGAYGQGSTGDYREETTPVDHFDVANAFGLSEMHGNVWEWCLDHWHSNYDGAPTDGSAWLDPEQATEPVDEENDNRSRLLRGGSWNLNPRYCRSATRGSYFPRNRFNYLGFRVVCEMP